MNMKNTLKRISAVLSLPLLFSCASSKQVPQGVPGETSVSGGGRIFAKEEIEFPVGRDISSPSFIGTVYREDMIVADGTYDFPQTNNIVFEPGARSAWHRHGGMIVMVTGGVGYYQEEGKKAWILREGDVVQIPAGARHWHGAAPDSWFSQMVIYDAGYTGAHDDGPVQHVSDEEYAALEQEEFPGRKPGDGGFMFPKGKASESVNFNGTVYLSDLAGDGNAAGSPGLHYVVFEPGVINRWHRHEGGQVLIATDGIGYHQIEGQEVQVMLPGDVAICPPGVVHWHGAAADSPFAHIAANANLNQRAVEWLDMLPQEAYRALSAE